MIPKVSVIIPNYNHSKYLEQRIESVLNQTFQDFEVILMDDCSPDNSAEIIEKYRSHPKVSKVLLNEVNSGSTFKQWNKGIKEANGEYIWIAESDDYADIFFLETLINGILSNEKVGIAYCDSIVVDENSQMIDIYYQSEQFKHETKWQQSYCNDGIDECKNYFIHRNIIPNASACVFKKKFFWEVGGANENMKVNGDWLLWIKILEGCKVAYIQKPLNYFRTHLNNVRTKSTAKGNNIKEIFEIQVYIATHFDLSKKEKRTLVYNMLNRWISTLIVHKQKVPFNNQIVFYKLLKNV
jgi:glycosyltransferase involved in cell wall biosynthesis